MEGLVFTAKNYDGPFDKRGALLEKNKRKKREGDDLRGLSNLFDSHDQPNRQLLSRTASVVKRKNRIITGKRVPLLSSFFPL